MCIQFLPYDSLLDPILPDILRRIYSKFSGNQSQPLENVLSVTALYNTTESPQSTGKLSLRISESINSNGQYGFLVAAKGAAQFICNPFVGLLVTRLVTRGLHHLCNK